ncbi:hypothetical protein ACROYT_G028222 [Oculina patagonica]
MCTLEIDKHIGNRPSQKGGSAILSHPSHVIYKGKCNCGVTYIGETARNLEVRANEHLDVNKQSEPAKHIRKHPNHKFTWNVLTTAHSWLKRRIKEAFYIARYHPELNKQVQSLDLTLFPMGTENVEEARDIIVEDNKELLARNSEGSQRTLKRYMPSSEISLSEPQSAKEKQFVESVEQRIERMPQATIREVVRNILDEPISFEVQERLLKPLLSQRYHPKPPQRLRRKKKKEQKRKNIQNEFDPFLPHENRVVTNYQNEILNLLDAAEYDWEEENGRRFIRWRFIRGLEKDLTPNFMENIRGKVNTAFYIRHVYSYRLRNIDNDTVIVYYINHGSSWINKLPAAEKWLREQETKRLASDNIKRPSTKWKFVSFFNVDVKVVLDRQPLLGTGPLPDWLRNLAHGRSMVALDTYLDNLCLWRCIAVHRGARIDRSTAAARGLAKSFFELETVPTDCPKTSLDEFDKVERHLNQGAAFSDWLGIRVYEPVREKK